MSKLIISTALITLFLAAPTFAKEAATDKAQSDVKTMEIVKDAIKSEKKAFVAVNLKLTEEESKKFWPLYEKYQSALSEINRDTGKLINQFADKYESLSDRDAMKLLKQSLKIRQREQNVKNVYLGKFKSVLPGKKVARYYQLENKVAAVIDYELASAIPLAK